MIKIAIDAREFKNGVMTGIGRFLKNFIVNSAIYLKDLELILLGEPDTLPPFPLPENSRLVKFSAASTLIWEQICIRPVIKREKPDIFFSPYYKRPLFIGVPSVIVIHDLIPLIMARSFSDKFILKPIMNMYARRSSIVTDSENSRRDISNILKISSSRINVVYNAVDTQLFHPKSKEEISSFLERKNIKGKYILYVGNSNPHKNLLRLVLSYLSLPKELREKYKLVIAGTEKDRHFNLDFQPLLLGKLLDEELPLLYSGASLFVFPSLYEGFGLTPLEAMACGCPVLSSCASSMPEVLGDAAEYFNPLNEKEISSKMEHLLSNPSLLEALSAKGPFRAAIYSKEKFCRELFNVLMKAARK